MPNVHRTELIGQEVIAARLGITSQAISGWYHRGLDGMPTPTYVEYTPGKTPLKVWRRAQLPVWEKWYAKHQAARGRHTPIRNRKEKVAA